MATDQADRVGIPVSPVMGWNRWPGRLVRIAVERITEPSAADNCRVRAQKRTLLVGALADYTDLSGVEVARLAGYSSHGGGIRPRRQFESMDRTDREDFLLAVLVQLMNITREINES